MPTGDPAQTSRELEELRLETLPRSSLPAPSPVRESPFRGSPSFPFEISGASQRINNGGGVDSEIEIAASSDGKHIVVANNLRDFTTSHDGGLTFQPTKSIDPGFTANGDPSLAYGKSGNFYYAFIAYPSSEQCTTALAKSEDNGGSFDFQAAAVVCDDTSNKCFPDQEHIAADRFQAASGGDWIYSVWRNFVGGDCTDIMGPVEPSIVCSSDSGATWTTPKIVGTGDFPRVTVSQDGSVYAVYLSGDQIMLNKFSSCDAGLEQQTEFPRPIAEHRPVDCDQGVPGLDRCNGRNTLASPMLAVDDTDPLHLYLAYASKTADGTNENILVQDSTDGGLNWRTPEVGNSAVDARRHMPWICTTKGVAFISWYDRRSATTADNSLTEYFGRSAFLDGRRELSVVREFRISEAADSNCERPLHLQSRQAGEQRRKLSGHRCPQDRVQALVLVRGSPL